MLLVWNSRSCEYKFLSKARAQLKNFVNRDKYETAVRKHRKEANFFFPLASFQEMSKNNFGLSNEAFTLLYNQILNQTFESFLRKNRNFMLTTEPVWRVRNKRFSNKSVRISTPPSFEEM